MTIAEYEYDYLCSQSRHIVGYSEGGGIYMKTPYVYCSKEKEGFHNFTRPPHVEKKLSEPLLQPLYNGVYNDVGVFVEKFGLTYSPLAI